MSHFHAADDLGGTGALVLDENGAGNLNTSTWTGGTAFALEGTRRVTFQPSVAAAMGTNLTGCKFRVAVSDDAGATWQPVSSQLQSAPTNPPVMEHTISAVAGDTALDVIDTEEHSAHKLTRIEVKAVAGGALAATDVASATGRYLE